MPSGLKRRPIFIIGALLVGVLVATHRLWLSHGQTASSPSSRIIRLGRLAFRSCTLREPESTLTSPAWCGTLQVPENWRQPDGHRITLRVALIRARRAHPAPDPVLYLAGGPGQSAIATWPDIAPALDGVLSDRNVILMDQRGTGGSTPLSCPQKSGVKPERAPARLARLRAWARACLAHLHRRGLDPGDFTTTQTVWDLVALRRALGDPEFNLVGVSYGTRVAQEFVMQDPQAVRSVILDSVVPDPLILGQSFGVNLDHALRADFALCTEDPGCHRAFGNPWNTLLAVKRQLVAHPVRLRFRSASTFRPVAEKLTAGRLIGLVRLAAYSPLTAALLPLTLHAAAAGHFRPLLAESHWIRHTSARSISLPLQLSVVCSEDVPWLHVTPAEATSLLGARPIRELDALCAIWPRGYMPADFHEPLRTSVPTLILEGDLDPVTPPRYGAEVLKGLTDGRLLIVPGGGHNVIGMGCLPHLVSHFIRHPDPQAIHAGCLRQIRPVPPFLNYNGAAP